MSLNTALTSAVAGLSAQSAAISAVSENISNASTTAYKTREISFQSLVTSNNAASTANSVGGSVSYSTTQATDTQGTISITDVSTNLAIDGDGYFVVTDDINNSPTGYTYTRDGTFSVDDEGYLINDQGVYLMGYATDEFGNITATNTNDLSSLVPIDLTSVSGTAQETSVVEFAMNLPADAAVGDTFTTSFEIYDELGVSHTVVQDWTKTAQNTWTVDYSDPYQTSLGSASGSSGTIDVDTGTAGVQTQLTFVFDGEGAIDTINGAAADAYDISISTIGSGSSDIVFSMDSGAQGGYSGITQYASDEEDGEIDGLTVEQDGVRYGQLSSVEITDDGLVNATFDNGVEMSLYQVTIATFDNTSGLTNVSGTIYDENEAAGNVTLSLPGDSGAGSISAGALEASTTDTSDEFNKMIVAQQAYSSAAQIVSAVDEMFDSLLSAVR